MPNQSVTPPDELAAQEAYKQALQEAVIVGNESTTAVYKCDGCGLELPLRNARPGEQPGRWKCAQCERVHDSVLVSEAPATSKINVILAPFAFGHACRTTPPPAVPDSLRHDVRESERNSVEIPVVAMPLDDNYSPSGEAFTGTIVNISTSGLGMIHRRAVETRYLALEFTPAGSKKIQAVLEVLHCRSIGLCYASGGRLTRRVGT